MHSSKLSSGPATRLFSQGVSSWLIVSGVLVIFILLWIVSEPVPQDLGYHNFADGRSLFGIPNALNVVSNLLFLLVGYWGLRTLRQRELDASLHAWLYAVFFLGIGLIGLGSAYYHWSPREAVRRACESPRQSRRRNGAARCACPGCAEYRGASRWATEVCGDDVSWEASMTLVSCLWRRLSSYIWRRSSSHAFGQSSSKGEAF